MLGNVKSRLILFRNALTFKHISCFNMMIKSVIYNKISINVGIKIKKNIYDIMKCRLESLIGKLIEIRQGGQNLIRILKRFNEKMHLAKITL